VSLAAELEASGHRATAIPGGGGQFDVLADGELVFSKRGAGRFPEDGEVLRLLRPS
jgi:predicted Rdx family selenoprotein